MKRRISGFLNLMVQNIKKHPQKYIPLFITLLFGGGYLINNSFNTVNNSTNKTIETQIINNNTNNYFESTNSEGEKAGAGRNESNANNNSNKKSYKEAGLTIEPKVKSTIKVANTPSIFNKNLKDKTKKNVAFLISQPKTVDRSIVRKLNAEVQRYAFNPVNMFNASSLGEFDSFYAASDQFVTSNELDQYVDAYFICEITQSEIPNLYDKSQYTSLIEVDGVLINLKNLTKIPFNYKQIREVGVTQKTAHSNAVVDFIEKVAKFVGENY